MELFCMALAPGGIHGVSRTRWTDKIVEELGATVTFAETHIRGVDTAVKRINSRENDMCFLS